MVARLRRAGWKHFEIPTQIRVRYSAPRALRAQVYGD